MILIFDVVLGFGFFGVCFLGYFFHIFAGFEDKPCFCPFLASVSFPLLLPRFFPNFPIFSRLISSNLSAAGSTILRSLI